MSIISILGSFNSPEGIISPMGIERINIAVKELDNNPESKIIATGGFGYFNESSIPHHKMVEVEIRKLGVEEDLILPGLPAKHTVDDALMLKELLDQMNIQELTVVTSQYHRVRCLAIFADVMPEIEFRIIGADNMMEEGELAEKIEKECLRLGQLVRQGGVIVGKRSQSWDLAS